MVIEAKMKGNEGYRQSGIENAKENLRPSLDRRNMKVKEISRPISAYLKDSYQF